MCRSGKTIRWILHPLSVPTPLHAKIRTKKGSHFSANKRIPCPDARVTGRKPVDSRLAACLPKFKCSLPGDVLVPKRVNHQYRTPPKTMGKGHSVGQETLLEGNNILKPPFSHVGKILRVVPVCLPAFCLSTNRPLSEGICLTLPGDYLRISSHGNKDTRPDPFVYTHRYSRNKTAKAHAHHCYLLVVYLWPAACPIHYLAHFNNRTAVAFKPFLGSEVWHSASYSFRHAAGMKYQV